MDRSLRKRSISDTVLSMKDTKLNRKSTLKNYGIFFNIKIGLFLLWLNFIFFFSFEKRLEKNKIRYFQFQKIHKKISK